MKCLWLTDVHLNFLEKTERQEFYANIRASLPQAIFLTGDIAEAPTVAPLLEEMANALNTTIYFVLGNHDFYFGDVATVKKEVTTLTLNNKFLRWLPIVEPVSLTPSVVLVGQDGWADGRVGNYVNSSVVLADSRLIADLFQQRIIGKYQLLDKMQQLADIDAQRLEVNLQTALLKNPTLVIVLTHVPPFKEVCLYDGKISNDDWLPFFTSQATADVLTKVASENINVDFLVLCGHTHHVAKFQAFPNLLVKAGHAEYYMPELQEMIEF